MNGHSRSKAIKNKRAKQLEILHVSQYNSKQNLHGENLIMNVSCYKLFDYCFKGYILVTFTLGYQK